MIRRPPRSTQSRSSAASDVYKRQFIMNHHIQYWKQERAALAFRSNEQVLHLENGWFSGLRSEDVLWILTSATRDFDLVLAIRARVLSVEKRNSHPAYAISNSKEFRNFRANFYPDDTTAPCMVPVPEHQLRQLRFKSAGGIKSLGNEEMSRILSGPLASRRKLADGSEDLLELLWRAHTQYPWIQ